MHYTLGNENYITGDKVVYLVFNEIAAIAFGDEIDLKMRVAVLAHGLSAGADYIGVNVEIKFSAVA